MRKSVEELKKQLQSQVGAVGVQTWFAQLHVRTFLTAICDRDCCCPLHSPALSGPGQPAQVRRDKLYASLYCSADANSVLLQLLGLRTLELCVSAWTLWLTQYVDVAQHYV